MKEDEFLGEMAKAEMLDLTVPFSVQTPQWLNYIPLSVTYTKRVAGPVLSVWPQRLHCNASIHLVRTWMAKALLSGRRPSEGTAGRMGRPGVIAAFQAGQRFQCLHP